MYLSHKFHVKLITPAIHVNWNSYKNVTRKITRGDVAFIYAKGVRGLLWKLLEAPGLMDMNLVDVPKENATVALE